MSSKSSMHRRKFLKVAGATAVFSLLPDMTALAQEVAVPKTPAPSSRPNILLFLSDDHAQWAQHAYGNSELKTPNLDRLAQRGVRMTRAFTTSPVCSPARASLWTGRMPSQHGIHDWLYEKENAFTHPGLRGQHVLGELLKQAGYHTALVGKWHCGREREPQAGFDRWFSYWVDQYPHDGPQNFSDQGQHLQEHGPQSPLLTRRAIEFLQSHHADPKLSASPFFLAVGYVDTHSPHDSAPKDLLELYKDAAFKDIPEEKFAPCHVHADLVPAAKREAEHARHEQYYGAVSSIDREVGKILAELETTGQLDNTLIIYTGDHGLNCGQHGVWEKGNATTPQNFLEESILVGCTISWPRGGIKQNSTIDQIVNHTDLFNTLLDVAGAIPDAATTTAINSPGKSYLPQLRGEPAPANWSDAQFSEYGNARMIRTNQYKLIIRYPYGGVNFPNELYDLKDDPRETVNHYPDPAMAEVVKELRTRLDKFFAVYNTPEHDGLKLAAQPQCTPFSPWITAAKQHHS